MRKFNCSHCDTQVFIENDRCVSCGKRLGFIPDALVMRSFDELPDGIFAATAATGGGRFKSCQNGSLHNICNWMVPEADSEAFCVSCRLNETIPDLSVAPNLQRWHKLEVAKRRCLYTLLRLHLPLTPDPAGALPGLQFRFLGEIPGGPAVTTGHESGVITLNIAEADEIERERRRLALGEPLRTLVGHFRHELGHYYWLRLMQTPETLQRFREMFGDETTPYGAALEQFYRTGPSPDWTERNVSAYASMHPWEDWAETWAHYFHMTDTFETVDCFGLRMESATLESPADDFDALCNRWMSIACALNEVNRGIGLMDFYPFVITKAVRDKLRFVHELIGQSRRRDG